MQRLFFLILLLFLYNFAFFGCCELTISILKCIIKLEYSTLWGKIMKIKILKNIKGPSAIVAAVFALVLVIMLIFINIKDAEEAKESGIDLKNFNLETISDEAIITQANRSKSYSVSKKHYGKSSGISDTAYLKADYDNCEFSCRKIIGIMTVSATKIENATLNLTVSSTLNSGKMKIVVIQDNQILEEIPVGEPVQLNVSATEESLIYVKVIGEDANMKISVTREIVER